MLVDGLGVIDVHDGRFLLHRHDDLSRLQVLLEGPSFLGFRDKKNGYRGLQLSKDSI